jgi:hypothetical protein
MNNLQSQIQALGTALGQAESADAKTLAALKSLQLQIEHFLNQHDERTLTERLENLAVRFENDHPTVGKALRQAIDALSKAGM